MTMCKADSFVKNSGTEGNANAPLVRHGLRLSQTPGLALRLEQAENVVLADCKHTDRLAGAAGGRWKRKREKKRERTRALDVADDGAGLVVHELDTALGDTTTGAYISVSLRLFRFFISRASHAVVQSPSASSSASVRGSRTGSAKDTSDLDELDGGLSGIHCVRLCVRRETVVRCGFARRVEVELAVGKITIASAEIR